MLNNIDEQLKRWHELFSEQSLENSTARQEEEQKYY